MSQLWRELCPILTNFLNYLPQERELSFLQKPSDISNYTVTTLLQYLCEMQMYKIVANHSSNAKLWQELCENLNRFSFFTAGKRTSSLLNSLSLSVFNFHFSRWIWVRQYQIFSILDFVGAKGDGGGGDNWSYKTCKVPVRLLPANKPTPSLLAYCFSFQFWLSIFHWQQTICVDVSFLKIKISFSFQWWKNY